MPTPATPPGGVGGPGHVVVIEAKKLVTKESPDEERDAVLTELKTAKSLVDVAEVFHVWDAGGTSHAPVNAQIKKIVKGLTPAQREVVRTAVKDALEANRNVVYHCAVEDLANVTKVHFHIHVDSKTTTIETCPGPHT